MCARLRNFVLPPPRAIASYHVSQPPNGDQTEEQERMMPRNRAAFLAFMSAAILAGAGAFVVHAQSAKAISSYGPNNQDMTFEQIKAGRLAVKAERAKRSEEPRLN